jgi:hypothetical protein
MQKVSLEELLATAFSVPLVRPNQHPSDLTVRWGLSMNIIGLSGVAKTQRIKAAAAAVGLPLQTVFPSHRQPEDFGGINFVNADGLQTGCGLAQARKLMEAGKGVFFIDELATARPTVQAACLGVVDSRSIGDQVFSGKVRMLTAMNPPDYSASGFALEAPMANRLAHINYEPPTVQEWCDYQLGISSGAPLQMLDAEERVCKNWDNEQPMVRALVQGFLNAVPQAMHDQPLPNSPASGGAWPSHRMWEYAQCAMTTVRCLGMPKALENELLFACIGDKYSKEWISWCQKADIPTPEQMLTRGWFPDPDRQDIAAMALQSMWSWLVKVPDKGLRDRYAGAAWAILDSTIDVLPDMAIVPTAQLLGAGLDFENPDIGCKANCTRVLKKLRLHGFDKFYLPAGAEQ